MYIGARLVLLQGSIVFALRGGLVRWQRGEDTKERFHQVLSSLIWPSWMGISRVCSRAVPLAAIEHVWEKEMLFS